MPLERAIGLNKVLSAALSGCVGIILMMTAAWAHDVQQRNTAFDLRLNTAEQHYATLEADIQDLREHIRDLKSLINENKLLIKSDERDRK